MNETFTPDNWVPIDSMIKVIGVGGGGCNAVTYMYNQNIEGCSFVVCNTDSQALQKSNVPLKIQLGEGLGAGTNPTKGRNAALESQDEIAEKVLNTGTQMLFITAGMGGGTGTGASPVIAKMAKDKGILTVGVVTLPFRNEGDDFLSKAVDGIHELEKNVDSLLIINNEKLYEFFGNQLVQDAFPRADEVLATAVRGIIEIINKPGYVNVDFEDVKTMMKNSGMALMGCGSGSGKNRLEEAVRGALESPLLNDFDLKTCKNLLINITAPRNDQGLKMEELNKISSMITEYTGSVSKFKRGLI
ncbi:MAG: cell division protein FtsZ, partial [Bacteroidales bacterium]|nr:cell division protein FtsZ [Bacteroidales bacterium]